MFFAFSNKYKTQEDLDMLSVGDDIKQIFIK